MILSHQGAETTDAVSLYEKVLMAHMKGRTKIKTLILLYITRMK